MRALIADGHTIVRERLVAAPQAEGDIALVVHAAAGPAERMQNPERDAGVPSGTFIMREREAFHPVAEGPSTQKSPGRLDIGMKTADNHRGRVLDKPGMRNTAEPVRYALRRGRLE